MVTKLKKICLLNLLILILIKRNIIIGSREQKYMSPLSDRIKGHSNNPSIKYSQLLPK